MYHVWLTARCTSPQKGMRAVGEGRRPVPAPLQAGSPGMRPVGDGIRLGEACFAALLVEVGMRRVADAELVTCMSATAHERCSPWRAASELDSKVAMKLQLRDVPSCKICQLQAGTRAQNFTREVFAECLTWPIIRPPHCSPPVYGVDQARLQDIYARQLGVYRLVSLHRMVQHHWPSCCLQPIPSEISCASQYDT
jgi:hypothetical protein